MCPSFLIKAGKRVILIIFIFFDTHSHCHIPSRICDFVPTSNKPYIILSAYCFIRVIICRHTRYYPNQLIVVVPLNTTIQCICYITKFKVIVSVNIGTPSSVKNADDEKAVLVTSSPGVNSPPTDV